MEEYQWVIRSLELELHMGLNKEVTSLTTCSALKPLITISCALILVAYTTAYDKALLRLDYVLYTNPNTDLQYMATTRCHTCQL